MNLNRRLESFDRRVINYEDSFRWGLNGLMLVIMAFIFLRRPASLPFRASGLAVAGYILAASFAVVAIPLLWATFDELLFVPVRPVIFVMYCCFWTAVGAVVNRTVANAASHQRRVTRMAEAPRQTGDRVPGAHLDPRVLPAVGR